MGSRLFTRFSSTGIPTRLSDTSIPASLHYTTVLSKIYTIQIMMHIPNQVILDTISKTRTDGFYLLPPVTTMKCASYMQIVQVRLLLNLHIHQCIIYSSVLNINTRWPTMPPVQSRSELFQENQRDKTGPAPEKP